MLTGEILEFNICIKWDQKKEVTASEKQVCGLSTVPLEYNPIALTQLMALLELVLLPALTTWAVDSV